MHDYTGDTRVALTTTGWLLIAQEAVLGLKQASNQKQSAQLRCKAERSLRMALVAIDEDRRRTRQSVNRLPASLPMAKKPSE
jgi:hypothetical protein